MFGLDRRGVAAVAAAFMVIAAGVAAAGTQDEPPVGGTVRQASATTEPSATASASADPARPSAAPSEGGTTATVTGVVQVDHTPIGGVVVTLVAGTDPDGPIVDEALTSANGRFEFSPTGDQDATYVVVASDPAGEHAATTSGSFTLDRDRRLTIAMPTSAILDGDVVDETGDVVVGATVLVTDSDHQQFNTTTDGAGHFHVAGLTPGRVTISVRTAGGEKVTVKRSATAGTNLVNEIVVSMDDPEPTPDPTETDKPDDGTGFTDQNDEPVNNS